MGNVLKADAASAAAYVEQDISPTQSEVWLTADLGYLTSAITYWVGGGFTSLLMAVLRSDTGSRRASMTIAGGAGDVFRTQSSAAFGDGGTTTPSALADGWHTYELHFLTSGTVDLYIDGTLQANVVAGSGDVGQAILGQESGANTDPAAVVYIKGAKVGTTRGGSDLATFADGDLGAWTNVVGDVTAVPDPFAPAPPIAAQVYADMPWRVIVTDKDSVTLALLDHRASNRQFVFTLNAPASHSGQVASDDPIINLPYPGVDDPPYLTNNSRLVYAFRRERTGIADALLDAYVCRFGGILTTPEDQGADTPTTTYTAYDPWQYLMSRPVRDPNTGAIPGEAGLTFPAGTRASEIALDLLITTEVVDGETHIDFGGTFDPLLTDTEPLPDAITFSPGLSVGEAWQQLVATATIDIVLPPLYDPDKPGKVCQLQISPLAGQIRYDTLMAWDVANHSAIAISRLIDGTRMANKVQFWSNIGGPAALQTDAASVTANGEWWAQQFFPDQASEVLIGLAALAELLLRRNGARTISFDPAPERSEIPLRDYGLGDYVPVWASRNLRQPLGIDYDSFDPAFPGASGYQRIQSIPINVDDDGTTRVQGLVTTKENV